MSATVHQIRSIQPVAGYIRVGHNSHRWLDDRLAEDALPFRRFIFDASHIDEQKRLIISLKKAGCEIILDPNFAELGAVGKYSAAVSHLPWAHPGRPWEPSDFGREQNLDVAKLIAEFAVARQVDAVLSPSHVEEGSNAWRRVDLSLAAALRESLDQAGGQEIALDYQLIARATALREDDFIDRLLSDLGSLEFDNLWLRASGFGAHATGSGTRRYIESVRSLHRFSRPIVADMVGGMPALAAASFCAIGGFSHGIAQREDFRDGEYLRERTGGGGGGEARIYVPELDRFLSSSQLSELLSARGARSRFACRDTACCPQGRDDMVENFRRHFMQQRARQIRELSQVPETRRAEHFLLNHLGPAVRSSRLAATYKFEGSGLSDLLAKEKARLVRMQDALSALYENTETASRSPAPIFRGKRDAMNLSSGQL